MNWPFPTDDYSRLLTPAGAEHLKTKRTEWLAKRKPPERVLLEQVQSVVAAAPETEGFVHDAVVSIAARGVVDPVWSQDLAALVKTLIPWKKGPLQILDTSIDAEWRSDWKWNRISEHVSFEDKVVGDIGSHNGYFMFTASALRPRLVVGLEPVFRPTAQFILLQALGAFPATYSEPLGIEDIDVVYPQFFDTLLCMGILYHQTDPVGCLRKMYASLKPGGELLVECQGISSDDGQVLVPSVRYCGALGVWWLPSALALQIWMRRAGFRDVELFDSRPLTSDEQRATEWTLGKSFIDAVDPNDSSKTIEGYPVPWRHCVKARR